VAKIALRSLFRLIPNESNSTTRELSATDEARATRSEDCICCRRPWSKAIHRIRLEQHCLCAEETRGSRHLDITVMKFNSLLGPFAIAILMNACGGHGADTSALGHGERGEGDGAGYLGGSTDDGQGDAGASASDGDGQAGASESASDGDPGGIKSNGRGTGGSTSDARAGTGGSNDARDGTSGSKSDARAGAGGFKSDGDTDAGGSKENADADSEGGEAGSPEVSSSGGSGGLLASGGSGEVSSTGGSGGLSASGGFGGVSTTDGSGGLSASAGAGGVPTTGGSGGLSASGGSGGMSPSGGSGGTSGSAGSAGSAADGDGRYLFTTETFGGNGRSCVTCHTSETGTISAPQIQALYSKNPNDPLFRPIDSDDGASDNYTQLQAHATFRVSIALPHGVSLTLAPSATSVVFRRSVPSTINTPALDTVLMWDGREPTLTQQALDATLGHAQATVTPTATELGLIAAFEQGPDFFSSDLLRKYGQGGPAPTWPPGNTDSEQRGRRWFAQDAAAPRFNICGQCHGGPMANTTQSNSGLPVGQRFQTVNVSEFNELGNPTYEFTFPDPKNPGKTVTVSTPDPGRALVTGNVRDLNLFKIPSLWGVKNTAPYFHDGSVSTLDELMDHYEKHLATFLSRNASYPTPHVPTTQDKADIVAYLKLL
jgi:cytochrome c peroxidase